MMFAEQELFFILKVFLALTIPIVVGRVVASGIKKSAQNRSKQKTRVYKFIADTINIVALIFGIVSALGTIGINIGALIAGLGLTGLGLSFALKDSISNFVAGIILILYNPFDIDNKIKIGDNEGMVSEMDLRFVHLKSKNDLILIPNSTFLNSAVKILNPTEE